MTNDQYFDFRLQDFITQREGMIAENMQRQHINTGMAYTGDSFFKLAQEIRDFMSKDFRTTLQHIKMNSMLDYLITKAMNKFPEGYEIPKEEMLDWLEGEKAL
jgi:hypothetical protein